MNCFRTARCVCTASIQPAPLFIWLQESHTETIKTSKDNESLSFRVGDLSAVVNTQSNSFDLTFRHKEKLLTQLGWRSIGYVKEETTALHPKANYTNPGKGKRWVTYQLKLGVGDKVYGLGERFGPFAKNGQVSFLIPKCSIHSPTKLVD